MPMPRCARLVREALLLYLVVMVVVVVVNVVGSDGCGWVLTQGGG